MLIPLVDTLVHFWDHSVDGLTWPWLAPGPGREGQIRDGLAAIDAPRYTAAELRHEAGDAGLAGVVHVHGADGDPVAETAWLDAMGTADGWPDAVIAACRLAGTDAGAELRRHGRHARFRGVRDLSVGRALDLDAVAPAMATLAELGACVELRVPISRFAELAALARAWPGVPLVLNHAGFPKERTDDALASWSAAVVALAEVPTVVCKLSTVVSDEAPASDGVTLRRWVLAGVEAFGPGRCMVGSNWPLDRSFGTYRSVTGAYRDALGALSVDEQHAVLHGTAERTYRVGRR